MHLEPVMWRSCIFSADISVCSALCSQKFRANICDGARVCASKMASRCAAADVSNDWYRFKGGFLLHMKVCQPAGLSVQTVINYLTSYEIRKENTWNQLEISTGVTQILAQVVWFPKALLHILISLSVTDSVDVWVFIFCEHVDTRSTHLKHLQVNDIDIYLKVP